jgi:hypothetical protein
MHNSLSQLKEKDVEEYILLEVYNNPDKYEELFLQNNINRGSLFSQVNLGEYGVADLVSLSYHKSDGVFIEERNLLYIEIIEIKAMEIKPGAFLQAIRYATGISEFFKHIINTRNTAIRIHVKLLGKSITIKPNSIFTIPGIIDNASVFTYTIDKDNLSIISHHAFNKHNWGTIFNKNKYSGLRRLLKADIKDMIQKYYQQTAITAG